MGRYRRCTHRRAWRRGGGRSGRSRRPRGAPAGGGGLGARGPLDPFGPGGSGRAVVLVLGLEGVGGPLERPERVVAERLGGAGEPELIVGRRPLAGDGQSEAELHARRSITSE